MKVINWIFVLKETIILAKKQFIKLIFKNIIRKTQLRSNFKAKKVFLTPPHDRMFFKFCSQCTMDCKQDGGSGRQSK